MKVTKRLVELGVDWVYLIRHSQDKRQALNTIVQELRQLPYRRFQLYVVARSLLHPLPNLQTKIPLEIRPFEAADLELVRQINRPSEANLCARRLEVGHKGLSAFHEGQLVAYAWSCFHIDMDLERIHIKLEPGDCFSVDKYTSPLFRNKGVQGMLTLAQFRLLQEWGYSRVVAYIIVNNYPSLAVWHKMGGEVIDCIDYLRLGPWRRVRHQNDQIPADKTIYLPS